MAEPLFIDTNAWLRFLLRDDEAQYEAISALFRAAETGEHTLTISHMVFAEIEWTLRSFYDRAKPDIVTALRALLALRSLRVEGRQVLNRALSLYAQHNVDFVDAYNAADMQSRGITTIVSYDRDFDRLGVKRLAP